MNDDIRLVAIPIKICHRRRRWWPSLLAALRIVALVSLVYLVSVGVQVLLQTPPSAAVTQELAEPIIPEHAGHFGNSDAQRAKLHAEMMLERAQRHRDAIQQRRKS